MAFRLPHHLVAAAQEPPRKAWLDGLQATIATLQERWSLELGEPFEPGGQTAWVAPARRGSNHDLVLKVAWRHTEAEHEADALREWDGNAAVHIHASHIFEDTIALLLERCVPGTALSTRPELEQDVVVAALLTRLQILPPAGHAFRPLYVMCDEWADEFERASELDHPRLDPGIGREGIALFRSLPRTADREVLLCTDLHAGNVLAAAREPWLVIDPKPYVGDPTYDCLQHMLNCSERLHTDPEGLARRMAQLADLDPQRVIRWLFARCVQESPNAPELAEVARRLAPT